MIQFIDIENNIGSTYDGGIVVRNGAPVYDESYIFWFPGGQSINMYYSLPICFASDKELIKVWNDSNSIFSLVNINILPDNITINDVKYVDLKSLIIKTNANSPLYIRGTKDDATGMYLYMIYMICKSDTAGEYIETFHIDNDSYLVGADFYDENESLYINASNNGVELPVQIQSAIYCSNVREENTDNILLNRKLKELLSNYWNMIANKGSYKSLLNSLKWFEYGDIVHLKEIWKHVDFAKTVYDDKDINTIVSEEYEQYMYKFAKTANYALHLYRQKHTSEVDGENNPVLENIIPLWSWHDMALKMSMLGAFYETYFMPIHLNLIQSTIVDTVFMNNIKIHYGAMLSRDDSIFNIYSCNCNIKNGDLFFIGDVNIQVGPDTLFGIPAGETYDDTHILGVDNVVNTVKNDTDLKQFYSQLYNDRGCIIPIQITIPEDDIINTELISTNYYDDDGNKLWKHKKENKLYSAEDGNIHINFNLLYTHPGDYDIRMQFSAVSGKQYIKNINITIASPDTISIKTYKVVEKNSTNITDNNWNYMFSNNFIPFSNTYSVQRQYIPNTDEFSGNTQSIIRDKYITKLVQDYTENRYYMGIDPPQYSYKYITFGSGLFGYGSETYIHLNHVFVIKDTNEISELSNMYNIYTLPTDTEGVLYYIYISKKWYEDANNTEGIENVKYKDLAINNRLLKSQYEYIPFYHELVEFAEGSNIDDYIITDKEMLCFVPDLKYSKFTPSPDQSEWELVNASNPNIRVKINGSLGPVTANTERTLLPPGYYDIIYRFKSDDFSKTVTIVKKSAFIKK